MLTPRVLCDTHAQKHDRNLPRAHTCFNELELPAYSSKEVLGRKIRTIVDFAAEGFSMDGE